MIADRLELPKLFRAAIRILARMGGRTTSSPASGPLDPLLDGLFNEFRIYNYALSGNQVLGKLQAGPDIVHVPAPTSIVGLPTAAGCLIAARRRMRAA